MYSQQNEQIRLSIFDRLVSKFSSYLISADEAAQEIKRGMTTAAVRTAICRNKFPIATQKIMGTHMVRLSDLAEFLAVSGCTDIQDNIPVVKEVEKKKRGQRGPGKRRVNVYLMKQGESQ